MDRDAIEAKAYRLHNRIWKNRVALCIDSGSLVDFLNPALGAAALGIRMDVVGTMGEGHAGVLDRKSASILLSGAFPAATRRFTGAHELGHWLLHPGEVLHRDFPLTGEPTRRQRPAIEQEADFFAACYLMPRKSFTKAFEACFGKAPLRVNEHLAYALGKGQPELVMTASPIELAAMIAGLRPRPNALSIAEQFEVSVGAAAIRICELDLLH